MKNIRVFLSENFHFLVVKFSVYLNRRVFVMIDTCMRVSSRQHYSQIVVINGQIKTVVAIRVSLFYISIPVNQKLNHLCVPVL